MEHVLIACTPEKSLSKRSSVARPSTSETAISRGTSPTRLSSLPALRAHSGPNLLRG